MNGLVSGGTNQRYPYLFKGFLMQEIYEIDGILTPLHARLVSAAANSKFEYICDVSNANVVKAQDYPGIYLIEVGTEKTDQLDAWIETFVTEWNLREFHQSFTCTTKKKRILKHFKLSEWMPMYIGKSKKIGNRVTEHWSLPMTTRTFALKIGSRPNMQNRRFRLSTIKLEVENYNYIAPVVETALREKLHPIVGKA